MVEHWHWTEVVFLSTKSPSVNTGALPFFLFFFIFAGKVEEEGIFLLFLLDEQMT